MNDALSGSEEQYEIRPEQLHPLISGNIKIIENRFKNMGEGKAEREGSILLFIVL